MFFESDDKRHKLVMGTTAEGMSSLVQGAVTGAIQAGKSVVYLDADHAVAKAVKKASREVAVEEDVALAQELARIGRKWNPGAIKVVKGANAPWYRSFDKKR